MLTVCTGFLNADALREPMAADNGAVKTGAGRRAAVLVTVERTASFCAILRCDGDDSNKAVAVASRIERERGKRA